jgi:hypothetical protein
MVEFVSVTPARVADLNRALVICFNDLSAASVPKCGREIRKGWKLPLRGGYLFSEKLVSNACPFGHQTQHRKDPTYYRALAEKL